MSDVGTAAKAAPRTAGPPPKPRSRMGQDWGMALILAVAVFAGGALVGRIAAGNDRHFLPYLAATVFGILVGATELVARYRDKPTAPLGTIPGIVYIALNAAVSLTVLWLLRTGQLPINAATDLGSTFNQVLVAGFGSMALFRTSLFTLRVKDTDIAIGPAAVLQVILGAADRECDRLRAGPRALEVKRIMRGVAFDRAKSALVSHCLVLMQNLSPAEQSQLAQSISVLETTTTSDEVKAYNLGLLLMNFVGEDVLREAVDALDGTIKGPPLDDPPILSQAGDLTFDDMPALISICAALDPMDREDETRALRTAWTTLEPELEREADKNVIVLARLRRYFGADTVAKAIALLIAGKTPVETVTAPLELRDLQPPA